METCGLIFSYHRVAEYSGRSARVSLKNVRIRILDVLCKFFYFDEF